MYSQTPEQVYLDVAHKLENDHDYSLTDAKQDFTRLFHALRTSLAVNSHLKARILSADGLIQEQEIEIFNKDLEIFSTTTQLNRKDTPNP